MSESFGPWRERSFARRAEAYVLVLAVFFLGATGCLRKAPEETNLLLAVVGEKGIRERDFRRELERSTPALKARYRQNRMALLNQMIEEEVIYQKAMKQNLLQDPEVQRRLARARTEAAIERLKEVEIFKDIRITEQEIQKRYEEEVSKGGTSDIVVSLLYLSVTEDTEAEEMARKIENGLRDGSSFPQVAERYELPYDREPIPFDSPRFSQQLAPPLQQVARRMPNRSVVALRSEGTITYLVKDVESLSARYRRIRSLIRNKKQTDALAAWLAAQRANGTIRIHEDALKNMTDNDAVAAEVNGVVITMGDVKALRDRLPRETEKPDLMDTPILVNKAIDRELLRHEAETRNLDEVPAVQRIVEGETRRILVELLTERNVTGLTATVKAKSRSHWVEELKKEIAVKVIAENVRKMALPPSEEIEEVFGTRSR